jgi:hypothetical protein
MGSNQSPTPRPPASDRRHAETFFGETAPKPSGSTREQVPIGRALTAPEDDDEEDDVAEEFDDDDSDLVDDEDENDMDDVGRADVDD